MQLLSFENAPCFYFSADDAGLLIAVNNTTCEELGYKNDELKDKPLSTILSLPSKIFFQTHLLPILKLHNFAGEIFITLQRKDHQAVPVLINAQREIRNDGSITMYAGIAVHNRKKFEDELVNARKQAEEMLRENTALAQTTNALQANLEELDLTLSIAKKQNDELKQFSHVVTHELQEPLRKLSLYTSMLESEGKQSRKFDLESVIKKLTRVSQKFKSIVHGLQQYTWLSESSLKIKKLDLHKILSVVEAQLREQFPNVSFSIEAENLPEMEADQHQMIILLQQLLSNAIHFRKENEPAIITITCAIIQQNKFRHIADKYKYEDFVRVEIVDKGQGFEPEYGEHVFELFKKLHVQSGEGIGLSLCKKIVENHHGQIFAESKPMLGTTFVLFLPLKRHPLATVSA